MTHRQSGISRKKRFPLHVVTPAEPADSGRYVFAKWMEGCPTVSYDANGRPVCSGAIGTGWTLTAVMDRQYLFTYGSSNTDMGTVSGTVASGTHLSAGTSVTLAAAPNSTYKFTGWTLSNGYTCQIVANTSAELQNPCTLTLDADKGDLRAEGAFEQRAPVISARAVAVIDGTESAPTSASYTFTCRCKAQGSSEWTDCHV